MTDLSCLSRGDGHADASVLLLRNNSNDNKSDQPFDPGLSSLDAYETPPAVAGQWQVSYNCVGTASGGNSTSGLNGPWPSNGGTPGTDGTIYMDTNSDQAFPGRTQSSTGSITATFTWLPSSPGDVPLQSSLTVLESEHAYGGVSPSQMAGTTATATVNDSCADDTTTTLPSGSSQQGSHLRFISIQSSNGVWAAALPTRNFSAAGTMTGRNPNTFRAGLHVGVDYRAMVFNARLGGHSTVDTSAPGNPWDPTKPRFFSGTNCSATCTAVAMSNYVKQAQLMITDTSGTDVVVQQYLDASIAPNPLPANTISGTNKASAYLNDTFDSTHFSDGSSVTIKIKVTDSSGSTYDSKISGPVYNKAYVLANPYLTTPFAQVASTASQSMNHTVNNNNKGSITDTKPTILGQIPTYTAFYIDTHGGTGDFLDCTYVYPDLDLNNVHRVFAADVATAVANKPISQPPYNLAFVDGCLAGGDNSLANAFCPPRPGSDQVYLSWPTEVSGDSHNADWSAAFWTGLSTGLTVTAARDYADRTVGKPDINEGDGAAQFQMIGDTAAKLHGVYGSPDLGAAWHN